MSAVAPALSNRQNCTVKYSQNTIHTWSDVPDMVSYPVTITSLYKRNCGKWSNRTHDAHVILRLTFAFFGFATNSNGDIAEMPELIDR